MITTEDVVRATGGILLNGDMGIPFSGVSHDSRQINPGELFVALKGPRFDGHRFVLDAISAGAKGALVEYWPKEINIFELHRAISIIKVPDTLKALGDLAAYWRERLKAKVVAVTGSCGKSTTKEILAHLLSSRFKVHKNPGNWNNLIGTPLTILNTPAETEVLVLELGTNQPGEIARLTEITKPDVAVLVSVAPSHLEGLKSLEGVIEEKLDLFRKSPKNSISVYPFDQEIVRQRAKEICSTRVAQCLSFGFGEEANVRATDLSLSPSGTEFTLHFRQNKQKVKIPLLGRHFVHDTLAAVAASLVLGINFEDLVDLLSEIFTLPGRLEPLSYGKHLFLDDTYNANPASLKAACEVVKELKKSFDRAIAVIGEMKELGESSSRLHREAGRELALVFDRILALGEEAKALVEEAGPKARLFSNHEELLASLKSELDDQPTIVLVKGSRAMKMEKIIESFRET